MEVTMPEDKIEQKTLVMKFGGTSLGTPEAMAQAVEIVRRASAEWPRVVVVASALAGVTNLLIDSARDAANGSAPFAYRQAAERLRERHHTMTGALVEQAPHRARVRGEVERLVEDFANLCGAVAVLGEATPRAMDAVSSLGERMSVRILAAALDSAGIPAGFIETSELIITDDHFGAAHPDLGATRARIGQVLEPLLDAGRVAVVTGFIAATPAGVITTLGRGGSDYTAGLLGALLQARDVWIWTDVDGVMSADPRMVPAARTLAEISYREVAELAYYGAKVLHPKTIRPVVEAGIGLRICNTFNPEHPGTRLVANGDNGRQQNGEQVVKAVTAIRGQRLITIEGRGMLGVPGVAARAFGAVASTGTSVSLISQSSSEQSICFVAPAGACEQVLKALQSAFSSELALRDIDRIWATPEVAIITVVGAGMIHTPGIAGQIFGSLGQKGVNVIAIAQGSSEVSISLVVDAGDTETAVRALHQLIAVE
jgi:aspartate kinase